MARSEGGRMADLADAGAASSAAGATVLGLDHAGVALEDGGQVHVGRVLKDGIAELGGRAEARGRHGNRLKEEAVKVAFAAHTAHWRARTHTHGRRSCKVRP